MDAELADMSFDGLEEANAACTICHDRPAKDIRVKKGEAIAIEINGDDDAPLGSLLLDLTKCYKATNDGRLVLGKLRLSQNDTVKKLHDEAIAEHSNQKCLKVHLCRNVGLKKACPIDADTHVHAHASVLDPDKVSWGTQDVDGVPDDEKSPNPYETATEDSADEAGSPGVGQGGSPLSSGVKQVLKPAGPLDVQAGLQSLAAFKASLGGDVSLDSLARIGEQSRPAAKPVDRGRSRSRSSRKGSAGSRAKHDPLRAASSSWRRRSSSSTRRSRGHRKKRRRRSGSSSESGDSRRSPFRFASSRDAALKLHEKNPGKLARDALRQVELLMAGTSLVHGASSSAASGPQPIMTPYFLTHLLPKVKSNVRSVREARTVCAVLDVMVLGNVPAAMDILVQRLKAIEKACDDGNSWDGAKFLELIPFESHGLVTNKELMGIAKHRAAEEKLAKAAGQGRDRDRERPNPRDRWKQDLDQIEEGRRKEDDASRRWKQKARR